MIDVLKGIPKTASSEVDISEFWTEFYRAKSELKNFGMPFFQKMPSLLHLLEDNSYFYLKPDSVVMKVASAGLCIVTIKKPGN